MTDSYMPLSLILNIGVYFVASVTIDYVIRSIKQLFDDGNNEDMKEVFGFISIAIHIIVFIILLIALSGDK